MPDDLHPRMSARVERAVARATERVKLRTAARLLRGEGPLAQMARRAGPGNGDDRVALARTAARETMEALSRGAASEAVKRDALALLGNPAARPGTTPARRPLPPLLRRRTAAAVGGAGGGGGGSAPAWGDNWEYLQLRIDWTRCHKRVKASATGEFERGEDEMFLIGVLIDLAAPETDQRKISFHLGNFHEGERNEYGGSRRVSWAKISNAKSFPTGVVAMLSVVEKDYSGPYMDLLSDIAEVAKDELSDLLDGNPGTVGEPEPDDWTEILLKIIQVTFGALIAWFQAIARPEVLTLNGAGDPVFAYASADVDAPSDTWASTNHNASAKTFRVKGYGGDYELRLFYRRTKSEND